MANKGQPEAASAGTGAAPALQRTLEIPPLPAEAADIDMANKTEAVTLEERDRWLGRRDAHLARIEHDPTRTVSSENHIDVAILEEWLNGQFSDEYIEKYVRKYHDCQRCQATFEHYKSLKPSSH